MLVLAVDSSTEACAVGLYQEGEGIIGEGFFRLPLTHSQRLMPEVDRLLKGCFVTIKDVEGIIVTTGPGSFTGIRIGMATAMGLAQALHIPLQGVSTLELLSYNLQIYQGPIFPLIDAKGGRIYAGAYTWKGDERTLLIKEGLYTPSSWLRALFQEGITQGIPFGCGYLKYQEIFHQEEGFSFTFLQEDLPLHYPQGGTLSRVGYSLLSQKKETTFQRLCPNYLKASQAEMALQKRVP